MNRFSSILLLSMLFSGLMACDYSTLTEAQAKKAGEQMITLNNQKATPGNTVSLVKWKAFIQAGDKNAEMWGVVQSQKDSSCLMSGAFYFMIPKDGDWTLTSYYFRGERGDSCVWGKQAVLYTIPQ